MPITDDPTFEPAVRKIVREEISTAPVIKGMQAMINSNTAELKRVGVLLEHNNGLLENLSQIVSQALGNTHLWRENQHRLNVLEKNQKQLEITVGEHSRKLDGTS